jgi:hypothetical protein
MDDLFVMGASQAKATANIKTTLQVLHKLRWQVNKEKSSLVPSQCSEFLGLLVDTTTTPHFKVPANKIQAIRRNINHILHQHTRNSLPVQRLMAVAGLCVSLMKAVLLGLLMLCNIFQAIAQHTSLDNQVLLPPLALHDLIKW